MATLRNLSASALSVPALNNRLVEPDESVEVDNATATGFLGQDGTWRVELDDDDPRTADDLRAELKARDLPTTGRKSELIARLAQAGPVTEQQPPSAAEQMAAQNDEQGE